MWLVILLKYKKSVRITSCHVEMLITRTSLVLSSKFEGEAQQKPVNVTNVALMGEWSGSGKKLHSENPIPHRISF